MAKKKLSEKSLANLKKAKNTIKTTEIARERGRNGGIKSGESKRQKKLLSQIYADILADQSGIKQGGGFAAVVEEIMNNGETKNNSARVALLDKIATLTEGAKDGGAEATGKDKDLLTQLIGG